MTVNTSHLAILTYSNYAQQPHGEDTALREALTEAGVSCEIVVWDDPSVDFGRFSHAIISSCWDYDIQVEKFVAFIDELSKTTVVLNDAETVRSNVDKSYMIELSQGGIPVVPSCYIDRTSHKSTYIAAGTTPEITDSENFEQALRRAAARYRDQYSHLIIKPSQSASGKSTTRVASDDLEALLDNAKSIPDYATVIIQPYIDTIEQHGERSTVVIASKPCYTMKKVPKEGGYLVHVQHGGTYSPTEIETKDREFITRISELYDTVPLYMRVDYICDAEGNRMLLELELVEPYLYLDRGHEGLDLLVNALKELTAL